MRLVGLPGEMGLVWATALLTNLYAAMVVFVNLLGDLDQPITVAQTTVLTTMLLVAHGMPVELRICQKAGPRIRVMMLVRIAGALVLGWLLCRVYAIGDWASLGAANTPLWEGGAPDPNWSEWAIGQCWLMLKIAVIILALLTVMKLLEVFGITAAMNRWLEPLLRLLGMTPAAAPLAVIGMTLGITYGGGLIIRQAQSGRLGKRDIFYSLVLMSLCHSIVEDTMLMMALGAHVSGVLAGRLVFSLLATFVLVKLLNRVSDATFDRWFFRVSAMEPGGRST